MAGKGWRLIGKKPFGAISFALLMCAVIPAVAQVPVGGGVASVDWILTRSLNLVADIIKLLVSNPSAVRDLLSSPEVKLLSKERQYEIGEAVAKAAAQLLAEGRVADAQALKELVLGSGVSSLSSGFNVTIGLLAEEVREQLRAPEDVPVVTDPAINDVPDDNPIETEQSTPVRPDLPVIELQGSGPVNTVARDNDVSAFTSEEQTEFSGEVLLEQLLGLSFDTSNSLTGSPSTSVSP